jgi:hypothetical protein
MHIATALISDETYERMKIELIRVVPRLKYAVTDLKRVYFFAPDDVRGRWSEPGPGGTDLLPPATTIRVRDVFPLNQPCVFRSGGGRGRYVVHRIMDPFGPFDNCYIVDWPED